MTFRTLIIFTSLLSIVSAADHNEADHPELVAQLNSTDFHEREDAARQLWTLGRDALPLLRKAMASSDPERSRRAEVLVKRIEMGLTVSTSEEALADISRYHSTDSMMEKLQSLRGLIAKGAVMQALYLLYHEENPAHKKFIHSNRDIRSVALTSAQAALSNNDRATALSLLRLAPRADYNQRAYAHVLKYSGKLEKELTRVRGLAPTPDNLEWLQYLLQADGNRMALKEFAEETGNDLMLQILAALDGDATPILDHFMTTSDTPSYIQALRVLKSPEMDDRSDAVAKIIEGIYTPDAELDEKDLQQQLHSSIRIAMLLGERALGEKLLQQVDAEVASAYYARMDMHDRELQLMGIPDAQKETAEFNQWLTKEIALETDAEQGLVDHAQSKVFYIAEFYQNLGEHALAERILDPLLAKLRDQKDPRWFFVITEMKRIGMADVAIERALERGDKDGEFLTLTQSMFGDADNVGKLWTAMRRHYPDATREQHFRKFLSIMGHRTGDEEAASDIETAFQKAATSVKERRATLDLLAFAAESRGDYISMLQHAKALCALGPSPSEEDVFKYRKAAELQMDWQEIILSYDLIADFKRKSPVSLARYAIAQRKVGNTKQGDQLLNDAITQTMAMSEYSNYIGSLLYSAGYESEAVELWESVMLTSSEIGRGFNAAIYYLNSRMRSHDTLDQWKLAHSLALIESAYILDSYPDTIQPRFYLQKSLNRQLAYAMIQLESGQHQQAVKLLDKAHATLPSDGLLADYFFPALAGHKELKGDYARWFNKSWDLLNDAIKTYPNSHNTRNTIAWLGAKSLLKIDESFGQAKKALSLMPSQPAYLDTLAEVYFAKGQRQSAMKTSNSALSAVIDGSQPDMQSERRAEMFWQLSQQNRRFLKSPLPKASR